MNYDFDEIINRENTHCIKYDKRKDIFGTDDVIPMWIADMDFKSPDFIIDALKRQAESGIFGYSFCPDSTFDAFINWTKRNHQWQIEKDHILFSPSVVPSLNIIIMALTEPGDEIILQSPVYHPFYNAIADHQRNTIINNLILVDGQYKMDLENLKKSITAKTKMLLLCNPHNPGGRVWTKEELTELGAICKEKNIIIVSDEIHCDLIFKPHKHIPIASIKEFSQQSITCLSPNKAFNLAAVFASVIVTENKGYRKKIQDWTDKLHIGWNNIFATVAFEAAYTHGDAWINELMAYLKGNMDFATTFINKEIPMVKAIVPEATYLLWLDFRKLNLSHHELKEFMIKKAKLGLNDGKMFGKNGEGFQRLNFACPQSILEKGLHQLKEALR